MRVLPVDGDSHYSRRASLESQKFTHGELPVGSNCRRMLGAVSHLAGSRNSILLHDAGFLDAAATTASSQFNYPPRGRDAQAGGGRAQEPGLTSLICKRESDKMGDPMHRQ